MNDDRLVLAVPSKGRLMDHTLRCFAQAGMSIERTGSERGYRGMIAGFEAVEVAFLSASEIAQFLKTGRVHMGVTGEDLIREKIVRSDEVIDFIKTFDFGDAEVVVAVPQSWIDVDTMADLEEVAMQFHRLHGRRLRVATKYLNLTRRFFAKKGVTGYRIVESLGATEGAPAADAAELIVDITSTGTTIRANHLKVLDDGIILLSKANLVATRTVNWSPAAIEARATIEEGFAQAVD